MISTAGTTKELLKRIIGANTDNSRLCKVKSVDDTNFTCVVTFLENEEIEIFDVRLSVSDKGTNVIIPEQNSTVIISPFAGGYYVSMFSEIKQVYSATKDESILDLMLDFIKAIKAIQLLTNQGPTISNGVINLTDFIDLETRLKKFYLK
jgi:hypothetical protein